MDRKEDAVFDVRDLAGYLKVHPSWVYKNGGSIQHFKSGKYLRFKKSAIYQRSGRQRERFWDIALNSMCASWDVR